ncbi:MAG: hypothetical protein ACI4PF_05945, partial [Christensenellales bacterium]
MTFDLTSTSADNRLKIVLTPTVNEGYELKGWKIGDKTRDPGYISTDGTILISSTNVLTIVMDQTQFTYDANYVTNANYYPVAYEIKTYGPSSESDNRTGIYNTSASMQIIGQGTLVIEDKYNGTVQKTYTLTNTSSTGKTANITNLELYYFGNYSATLTPLVDTDIEFVIQSFEVNGTSVDISAGSETSIFTGSTNIGKAFTVVAETVAINSYTSSNVNYRYIDLNTSDNNLITYDTTIDVPSATEVDAVYKFTYTDANASQYIWAYIKISVTYGDNTFEYYITNIVKDINQSLEGDDDQDSLSVLDGTNSCSTIQSIDLTWTSDSTNNGLVTIKILNDNINSNFYNKSDFYIQPATFTLSGLLIERPKVVTVTPEDSTGTRTISNGISAKYIRAGFNGTGTYGTVTAYNLTSITTTETGTGIENIDGINFKTFTLGSLCEITHIALGKGTPYEVVEISPDGSNWYTVLDTFGGDSTNSEDSTYTISFVSTEFRQNASYVSDMSVTSAIAYPLLGGDKNVLRMVPG